MYAFLINALIILVIMITYTIFHFDKQVKELEEALEQLSGNDCEILTKLDIYEQGLSQVMQEVDLMKGMDEPDMSFEEYVEYITGTRLGEFVKRKKNEK